jgi:plasmid stabilization system protein ParE
MKYRVVVLRLAVVDLESAFAWAARRAPQTALRWLDRFHKALESLADNPQRCPLAKENPKVTIEIRELLFGRRPNVFRVIFTIRGDCVRILRIRRAQRRFLSRTQIEQADDPNE